MPVGGGGCRIAGCPVGGGSPDGADCRREPRDFMAPCWSPHPRLRFRDRWSPLMAIGIAPDRVEPDVAERVDQRTKCDERRPDHDHDPDREEGRAAASTGKDEEDPEWIEGGKQVCQPAGDEHDEPSGDEHS